MASAAPHETQAALSERQRYVPLETHASEPCLDHRFRTYKASDGSSSDEFTFKTMTVTVRTKMCADEVPEALYPLLLKHGSPRYIRSDDGPEFAAEAM